MVAFADWLIPLAIGLTFTGMGGIKLYGYLRGIVGGHDKPFVQHLCGT